MHDTISCLVLTMQSFENGAKQQKTKTNTKKEKGKKNHFYSKDYLPFKASED